MAQPDKNQLHLFKNTAILAKTRKSHFKPTNFIFKSRNKADNEEERLTKGQMHLITNAIGKETKGEFVQGIKPDKTNSLERNKAMNYIYNNIQCTGCKPYQPALKHNRVIEPALKHNRVIEPALKHINRVIETNQMREQNMHTASN